MRLGPCAAIRIVVLFVIMICEKIMSACLHLFGSTTFALLAHGCAALPLIEAPPSRVEYFLVKNLFSAGHPSSHILLPFDSHCCFASLQRRRVRRELWRAYF